MPFSQENRNIILPQYNNRVEDADKDDGNS